MPFKLLFKKILECDKITVICFYFGYVLYMSQNTIFAKQSLDKYYKHGILVDSYELQSLQLC